MKSRLARDLQIAFTGIMTAIVGICLVRELRSKRPLEEGEYLAEHAEEIAPLPYHQLASLRVH
jgi:hypothetical protein